MSGASLEVAGVRRRVASADTSPVHSPIDGAHLANVAIKKGSLG